jgi:hypothetical protein
VAWARWSGLEGFRDEFGFILWFNWKVRRMETGKRRMTIKHLRKICDVAESSFYFEGVVWSCCGIAPLFQAMAAWSLKCHFFSALLRPSR